MGGPSRAKSRENVAIEQNGNVSVLTAGDAGTKRMRCRKDSGRESWLITASPPSGPYRWFSRVRLSGQCVSIKNQKNAVNIAQAAEHTIIEVGDSPENPPETLQEEATKNAPMWFVNCKHRLG
jgi:hypothetical protein